MHTSPPLRIPERLALAIIHGCALLSLGLLLAMAAPLSAYGQTQTTPAPHESATREAIAATGLFNWAERTYPALFGGTAQKGASGAYVWRYYASTDTYLGVGLGRLYAITASRTAAAKVHDLGSLAVWACSIDPAPADVPDVSIDPWYRVDYPSHATPPKRCLGLSIAGTPIDYPIDGAQHLNLHRLNTLLAQCGFPVRYATREATAAAEGHANWQRVTGKSGHFQTVGDPGFTGTHPSTRLAAAGYKTPLDGAGEVIGYETLPGDLGTPRNPLFGLYALLAAPYHLRDLLASYREIGVSTPETGINALVQPESITVINQAVAVRHITEPPAQRPLVRSFPCEGVTDLFDYTGETPDPVPDRDWNAKPTLGPTIMFATASDRAFGSGSDAAPRLTVSSMRLTRVSDGREVPLIKPHQFDNAWTVGFMADHWLDPGGRYRVQASGTHLDPLTQVVTPWSKDFTFTMSRKRLGLFCSSDPYEPNPKNTNC